MFQGVAYKNFSLNNNVTDTVFHTPKLKQAPILLKSFSLKKYANIWHPWNKRTWNLNIQV